MSRGAFHFGVSYAWGIQSHLKAIAQADLGSPDPVLPSDRSIISVACLWHGLCILSGRGLKGASYEETAVIDRGVDCFRM